MLPRWATAEGFYGGALELQCELVVPHFAACNASRISHWCGEFIARCRGNTQPPSEIRAAPVLVTRRTAPWRHQTKCISYEAHTTPGRALLLGPWTGIGGGNEPARGHEHRASKAFSSAQEVSGPPGWDGEGGGVWSSGGGLVLRGVSGPPGRGCLVVRGRGAGTSSMRGLGTFRMLLPGSGWH